MKEEYAAGTRGASARVLCKFQRLWKATHLGAEKTGVSAEHIAKPWDR
jgi:hypothetical protein